MSVPVPLLPAGAKPRGDDFNKLRAQLNAQRITGAAGLLYGGFGGGSTLSALGLPPVIRRTTRAPFRLHAVSSTGTLTVGVESGTVNLLVPTLGGTALDNSTPPTLTITATRHLWLKCVGTFGSPDTYVLTVEDAATSTVPAGTAITATGFTSYLYLGYATVSGGVITAVSPVNYGFNWNVESLGSVNVWFKCCLLYTSPSPRDRT